MSRSLGRRGTERKRSSTSCLHVRTADRRHSLLVRPRWLSDAERLDQAIYSAIATTDTPTLDRAMNRLTRAADHSKLSVTCAALLAITRGHDGRIAAGAGLASV